MSNRAVIVEPFRQEWSQWFADEKEKLASSLNTSNVAGIHHIGSTSVEGLSAKPVIDILLEVNCLKALDSESSVFRDLGFQCKGEYGIKNRRFYLKDLNGVRFCHIHAFPVNSEESHRHLAYRDYLRENPNVRDAYGRIKQEGAQLHPNDMEAYIGHKAEFMKRYELHAIKWSENVNKDSPVS